MLSNKNFNILRISILCGLLIFGFQNCQKFASGSNSQNSLIQPVPDPEQPTDTEPDTNPPIAFAGSDFTISEHSTQVISDALGIDGEGLVIVYEWTKDPASDPGCPNLESKRTPEFDPRGMHLVGANATCTYNLVVRDVVDLPSAPDSITITVTDVITPSSVNSFSVVLIDAQKIKVEDNYAFVTDGAGGLKVFDISDATKISVVGAYNMGVISFEDIEIVNGYAFISNSSAGVQILDVSDPSQPIQVSSLALPGTTSKLFVDGDYLYTANGVDGINVVNIADVENPMIVGAGFDSVGSANDIWINGTYAYIADGTNGALILDITDPAAPALVSTFGGNIMDAASVIWDQATLYVADSSGLIILDVADAATPAEISNLAFATGSSNLKKDGDFLYVTIPSMGMGTVDVVDPMNPVFLNSFQNPGGDYVSIDTYSPYLISVISDTLEVLIP